MALAPLYKTARKISQDPLQEHLRQQKSDWNSRASDLISKTISFKRGLNGRGDPRVGLPPSNIKEPLPNEVGSFLSELAKEYSILVQQAEGIIREQAEYSDKRQKPRLAALEELLNKEASWWGSRLWSRISLRNLNKDAKEIRLRLLADGVDIIKSLRGFNRIIVNKNIPFALTKLVFIGKQLRVFLELIDKLEQFFGQAAKNVAAPSEQPSDKQNLFQTVLGPQFVGNQIPVDTILSQAAALDTVIGYIISKKFREENSISEQNIKNIIKAKNQFTKKIILYSVLEKQPEIQKNLIEIQELKFSIVENYNLLFDAAKSLLGEASSFHDLLSKIDVSKLSHYQFYKQNTELVKIAENAIKHWINQKMMQITPSFDERIILDISDAVIKAQDHLDKILDILENKNSSFAQIMDNLSLLLNRMYFIVDKTIIVSKMHMDLVRRKEKDKPAYIQSISMMDLREIHNLKNYLAEKLSG